VHIANRGKEKRERLAEELGVSVSEKLPDLAADDVLVLAVKPQDMQAACQGVQTNGALVLSVAAGLSIATLSRYLGGTRRIVRVMPNTPALVGEGMAGLFAAKNTSENDRTFAQELLTAVGKILWVDSEEQMHAVTAASGSSPAYFFQFLEAMQQGLIEMGLSAENARELVQQAMLGSAKMVVENPQVDLATLRQNVTSKGGTTAAALNVFNQRQFNDIVQQAMQACVARSKEMETLF